MNLSHDSDQLMQLQAFDLHFAHHGRPVLTGVNLSLGSGEVLALLGANGSGKSTLLRLMLGFVVPDKGLIELNGRSLNLQKRRDIARCVAYVPQMHAPHFPYTVREIAMLGRLPASGFGRAPSAADQDFVDTILQRLQIGHLAERPYTEISGGERQLALIARALAQGARILILDEPMTGLDYGHQLRLLERLRDLAAEGYAILKTTHHPEHALLASNRVALLIQGRIEADGMPADVVTPAAINRLYGVSVLSRHWGRHTAFFPSGFDRSA